MSTISQPNEAIVPKPWQTGVAPVYIGIFLWIAFFDPIGRKVLPMAGLGPAFLGVMIGGPLAYLCLYRSSASWSYRSGKSFDELASATFGVSGAKLVPGLLLGVAQVVLFGLAVGYAVELTFQGLILAGFVDPQAIQPSRMGGPIGRSPIYLATALFWAIATSLVSLKFTRWIGYLMQFFPIFPAVMLGGAMIVTLNGLKTFHPNGLNPPDLASSREAFLLSLQWVFAFSALAGVMGTDWGIGSVSLRDVRLGGWVGMAFAPVIVAILALIAIAGYQGSKESRTTPERQPIQQSVIARSVPPVVPASSGLAAPAYTFRAVMAGAFPVRLGALILATFGLGSLAPAVYASFAFGNRFKELGPGLSRLTWSMLGTCLAWLMVVAGWMERSEEVFNSLGAIFAPVAGAFAADYRRQKGSWAGARIGVNPAGLLAWGVGLGVGLCPTIGHWLGSDRLLSLQPAALLAFVASYLTYEFLGLIRCESRTIAAADPQTPDRDSVD